MKELTIACMLFVLTGCKIVTNGDELQSALKNCEEVTKESCVMAAFPESIEFEVKQIIIDKFY